MEDTQIYFVDCAPDNILLIEHIQISSPKQFIIQWGDYNSIVMVLFEFQHKTMSTVHVVPRNTHLVVISASDVGGNGPAHTIVKSLSNH